MLCVKFDIIWCPQSIKLHSFVKVVHSRWSAVQVCWRNILPWGDHSMSYLFTSKHGTVRLWFPIYFQRRIPPKEKILIFFEGWSIHTISASWTSGFLQFVSWWEENLKCFLFIHLTSYVEVVLTSPFVKNICWQTICLLFILRCTTGTFLLCLTEIQREEGWFSALPGFPNHKWLVIDQGW